MHRIITVASPRPYVRFNSWLVKAGFLIDRLFSPSLKDGEILNNKIEGARSILVLESHLIGDGVMTLAFINAIRNQHPNAYICLIGQEWMADLLPMGLVDKFISFKVPWIGPHVFSWKRWFVFFKLTHALRQEKFDLAMETRGDWRNFFFFWLSRVRVRLGSAMSGGRCFLTHVTRTLAFDEPLASTRQTLLNALGIESDLILPNLDFVPKTSISEDYIVVHPGASQAFRQISQDNLEYIFSEVGSKSLLIIVTSGTAESDLQAKVVGFFKGKGLKARPWQGTLRDFLGLCRDAKQVYAMDSGPAHLGCWANQNVTVFCGHDSPSIIAPLSGNH